MLDFYFIIALIIVITVHEFSHAFVSNMLGDPTAKQLGRISLNPLAHLDIMGTLMMFLIHIGWGKPVPINSRYFRHPLRDSSLTALAGPLANLLFALVLALPLKYVSFAAVPELYRFLDTVLYANIMLFAFNMLPFPPLDGSKIIGIFVPQRFQLAYQSYLQSGMIYFALFLIFDQFVLANTLGFSIIQYFIGNIFVFVKTIIFLGT